MYQLIPNLYGRTIFYSIPPPNVMAFFIWDHAFHQTIMDGFGVRYSDRMEVMSCVYFRDPTMRALQQAGEGRDEREREAESRMCRKEKFLGRKCWETGEKHHGGTSTHCREIRESSLTVVSGFGK